MISIPIQNRVAPIVAALAGALWFVLVAAALLLLVSGVAFAALGERPTVGSSGDYLGDGNFIHCSIAVDREPEGRGPG